MDQLNKQRSIIKSSITRVKNYCLSEEATESGIRARGEKVDEYFARFEIIQSSIEEHAKPEDLESEVQYRSEIENSYYFIKELCLKEREVNRTTNEETNITNAEISGVLNTLTKNQCDLSSLIERIASPAWHNDTTAQSSQQESVQLPRIKLPEFDGSYQNGIHFRDLYLTLIHNKENLSNIIKFEYLQAHVKGDALSLIKHLELSSCNYTIAWNLIKRKYDDSRQLKQNFLKLLFNHPAVKGPFYNDLKTLINTTNECIHALKALNEPVEQWDSVLLFHLERKIDDESLTLWLRAAADSPTYANFIEFLERRLRELENYKLNKIAITQPLHKQNSHQRIHTASVKNCPACQQAHLLFACNKFKLLSINERIQMVKTNKICFNCLQYNHVASNCTKSCCKICKGRHNTLLHREKEQNQDQNIEQELPLTTTDITVNTAYTKNNEKVTLLPTAVVMILGGNNQYYPCRILLDTGAQTTIIAESCVQRLNLTRSYDKTALCGIGNDNKQYTRGKVEVVIKSCTNNQAIKTVALCLSHLTQMQPAYHITKEELNYFNKLTLADPNYNTPNHIDLILGANVFNQWFMNEQLVHPSGSPTAVRTIFGWVIIGETSMAPRMTSTVAHISFDWSDELQNFWKIEEMHDTKPMLTEEEQRAEDHFQSTCQRDKTGRYIVRLPFKTNGTKFGNTQFQAIKRLKNMEKKFKTNISLCTEYKNFMNEYLDLKHMASLGIREKALYYLPHHGVYKLDSTTTKLRVVFDGSAKADNEFSLNEQLLVGPNIQRDIFEILLQFRKYKVALTGDIEKMYRQILIHPDDRAYQCIMWRNSENEPLKTFCLNTVTYGTSAAPFLASRTLKQIAIDYKAQNPMVSKVINQCFYVDDFISSFSDKDCASQLQQDLSDVLSSCGFHIRKWSSNSKEVLNKISVADQAQSNLIISDNNKTVKTLGLYWDTVSDTFKYSISLPDLPTRVTKRETLSIISRVFDPLGWASPVVIVLKLFMQKLWLRGLEWDSYLTTDLQQQWKTIYNNITSIQSLKIPRWLQYSNQSHVQLHGYADASEVAYSAVVYLKVFNQEGVSSTTLVASKTRVAPVKQVSLPRLELCACHLLVKLIKAVRNVIQIENLEIYGWTDSTIVLAWLSDHPRKWKSFVANRTSYIIDILPAQYWHHIASSKNPADIATRGCTPIELNNNDLWWQGPDLNSVDYTKSFKHNIPLAEIEIKRNTVLHTTTIEDKDLFMLYSDYTKLLRITALILRFSNNCKTNNIKYTESLKLVELNRAHDVLVLRSQGMTFKNEIKILSTKNQLPVNHKLSAYSPFIDDNNLLRIGGRLANTNLPYNQKHPLVLSKSCMLTELIVRYYHIKFLHAGLRQMHYLLGLKYWIPSGKYIIKRCVYKCVKCMRYRKIPFQQQMGNLPQCRVEAVTAFYNVGVDYAGPLFVRSWKGRGSKQYKCWISIFICMSTKAIHIELVTDLTTEAFIACLRRFVSRRGKPRNIYSDNGTNFVGSDKKLQELIQFMANKTTQDVLTREATEVGIEWHFSPPSAPNFGGLWEAGVKSIKHHVNRVLGNALVTYEELSTILCQIEGCLNSRPLTAVDGDADPLTPAHFLIMRPMESVPDQDVTNINMNRLTRWQYVQQLVQRFWKKWSTDYLNQLQCTQKWKGKRENLKMGDIVIMKEEQSPVSKWPIGKIVDIHPGKDGLVRVVTIKTQSGIYKRPITKLCPLIIDL